MLFAIFLLISIIDAQIIQNPIQLANHQMLGGAVELTVNYISSLEKTVLDSLEKESKEVTDSTEELLETASNKKRIAYLREERLKEVEALKHLARQFADAARMDLLKVRDYVSWYMELASMTTQLMSSYRVKMQAVLDQNEDSHELFEKKLERGANEPEPVEPEEAETEGGGGNDEDEANEENEKTEGEATEGETTEEETPEESTTGSQGETTTNYEHKTHKKIIKATRSIETEELEGSGDSQEFA